MNYMKKLSTSIVIVTKNRPGRIIRCIQSISAQTLLPDEVVIVDSSDTDELKSRLEKFQGKPTIKYLHAKTNMTRARNLGILNSVGDVVIFLDDDVVLDRKYIEEIVRVFQNDPEKRVGGVTGNILCKNSLRTSAMQVLGAVFFLPRYGNGKFQLSGQPTLAHGDKIMKIEFLSGCNMAFRREVLREFKFDEKLNGTRCVDDVDISYRVSRKYENIYTPLAKLIHNGPPVRREEEYMRIRDTMRNYYYVFKKNFPQTPRYKFAFWWAVVGMFVAAMLKRSVEGLRGLKDEIINITRRRGENRLDF
jgi:GT2 family glycosyltransferase